MDDIKHNRVQRTLNQNHNMNRYTKLLATMASVFLAGNISIAQDTEFDLSSQRSESQTVKKVPGEKLDHQGIVINPKSQSQDMTSAEHSTALRHCSSL